MKLGERIKSIRLSNKMTMQDLADRSGLSKGYISMLEKGTNPGTNKKLAPKLETIQQISAAFGMELEELLSNVKDDIELPELDNILTIYNSLESSRQERVIKFAKNQLQEQNNILDFPDLVNESFPKSIINGRKSAAGYAIEADDYDAEVISESMVPHGADELVEIVGDSMEPLIQKGSDVYIRHQPSVENGEVAIVRIENEGVTCKRFYYKDDSKTIILKSENEKYEDMFFDPSQVTVLGKVLI